MPRFRYSAYDGSGRLRNGEAEAVSLRALLEQLHTQGLHAFETAEVAGSGDVPWWQREVFSPRALPRSGLRLITRELATLLGAELPLDEALRVIVLQSPGGRMRAVLDRVLKRVLDGDSLSKALSAQEDAFPPYYVSMVAAGEASGSTSTVMEELAQHLDRTAEVRARISSALVYPLILMGMALVAIGLILLVLVPALTPVFEDAGATPPLAFRAFAAARNFVIGQWPIAAGAAAALGALVLFLSREPSVRSAWDRFVLRLPLAGPLVAGSETARFARVLATLVRSGVPLLQALAIAEGQTRNTALRTAIADVASQVKEGASLSEPMAASGLFPPLALRLIGVGERTGQLERMLLHVAGLYETSIQRQIDRLMSLITPALTIGIGLGVGGLILSVMNAILSVNEITFQ